MIRDLNTDLRRELTSDDKTVKGQEIPREAVCEWLQEIRNGERLDQ